MCASFPSGFEEGMWDFDVYSNDLYLLVSFSASHETLYLAMQVFPAAQLCKQVISR